jgi:uncharacterized Zn-finger protein
MALLTFERSGQGCLQRSWTARRPAQAPSSVVRLFSPRSKSNPDFCPVLSNDEGRREIPVTARHFACIGQTPPHDHPRIFLEFGKENEIRCPYCNTKYRFERLAA